MWRRRIRNSVSVRKMTMDSKFVLLKAVIVSVTVLFAPTCCYCNNIIVAICTGLILNIVPFRYPNSKE